MKKMPNAFKTGPVERSIHSSEVDSGSILEDLLNSFCEMKQSYFYDLPNWAVDKGS